MYPKVVALDTDYTIFFGWLNEKTWGKGRGAYKLVEDNIEQNNQWEVRDRTNWKNKCRMHADVPDIIQDILKNGAKLAIVSRNTNKAMCDRALWYFKVKDKDGNMKSLIDLVDYDEVYEKDKTVHFGKIKGWAGCHYTDMILFDDNPINNTVEMKSGVTFQVLRDKKGLTWANYNHGIGMWRRNKAIESPWHGLNLNSYPKKKFLGYSGMDIGTIKLLEDGGRRHDRAEAARWGYAMYVADDPAIAKYFSEWITKTTKGFSQSTVCEVYARDGDIWDRMNKIWVPNEGDMQTNNKSGNASKIARSQEDRDLMVEGWGVKKPYVLFARHQNMGDNWGKTKLRFPIRNNRRFNEMVVYPQIQESLIVIKRMSKETLEQAVQRGESGHLHYQKKMNAWNITVPKKTFADFTKHGENFHK